MRYLNDPTDPHDLDLTLDLLRDVVREDGADGRIHTADYVTVMRRRGFVPHEATWLIDTAIELGLTYNPKDNTLSA